MYILSSQLLLLLQIDDPLDAAPIHFFSGMWGLFSIGFFCQQRHIALAYGPSDQYGVFYGVRFFLLPLMHKYLQHFNMLQHIVNFNFNNNFS